VRSTVPLRLGTRGSLLALTQSRGVARALEEASGRRVELVTIRTEGDRVQDRPLAAIGGVGLFTRELDRALLGGQVDLAVHSLKDLPTAPPDGLVLGAVPEREDVRDVLIGPEGRDATLDELPSGARVGTGSLRRRALVLAHRRDLRVEGIRGNLDTRIRKVDSGDYEAIVLAAAGVRRLGWTERIDEHLDPPAWLPAPGQGALAVMVRADDPETLDSVRVLDHAPSRAATTAEREVMHALEAGCQLPVGALALPFGRAMRLRAFVAGTDGRRLVRAEGTGDPDHPGALGREVAQRLLEQGADQVLEEVERALDRLARRPEGGST
jgi:hydroxymethylbilane synthase